MLNREYDIVNVYVKSSISKSLKDSLIKLSKDLKSYESRKKERISELAIDEKTFPNKELLNFFLKREIEYNTFSVDSLISAYLYSIAAEDRFEENALRYMIECRFLFEEEKPENVLDPTILNYIRKYRYYSYKENEISHLKRESEFLLYENGQIKSKKIDISDEISKLEQYEQNAKELFKTSGIRYLIYKSDIDK